MNKLKISAVLMASIAITGCSGFFVGKSNAPVPAPIDASVNASMVRTVWSASGLGNSQETSLRFTLADGQGVIYVANANGSVSAIDSSSGQKRWSTKVDALYTGAATNGNLVFVGTQSGKLVALSAQDGKKVWSADLYGAASTSPVVADNRVIIRTIGGSVESFDAQTGDQSWAYMVQVPEIALRGGAAPVVVGKHLLVPTDLGLIGYLNVDTGAVVWGQKVGESRGGTAMARIVDIDAEPVIDQNIAYIPVARSGVSAVALNNGRKLWATKAAGAYAGLAVDASRLYVAYDDGNVGALSKRTGQEEWKSEALYARHLTNPVLINDRIVVGDNEGYVHVLDKHTGQRLGSTKVAKSGFMPDVLPLNNDVIFQDHSGNVYRITI